MRALHSTEIQNFKEFFGTALQQSEKTVELQNYQ